MQTIPAALSRWSARNTFASAVPPDDSDRPPWLRDAMGRAARDGLGQLLTTRLRAGDGEWADVLMMSDGKPLTTQVDLGEISGGALEDKQSTIMLMRGFGGLIAVAVDPEGRPVRSAASLDQTPKVQKP